MRRLLSASAVLAASAGVFFVVFLPAPVDRRLNGVRVPGEDLPSS